MSQSALFFYEGALLPNSTVQPDEDTARHIVQVLRKKEGDRIRLCNGKGVTGFCSITQTSKKSCTVLVEEQSFAEQAKPQLSLAVAFTKNAARNEWLLEKATELGVAAIFPLISDRTEREKFREDRARNILISAMLQSQQAYLPVLAQASDWKTIDKIVPPGTRRLLAHCDSNYTRQPISEAIEKGADCLLFIGPEGDFSPREIEAMTEQGYTGISLCSQRLRTETAAMSVCAYFNLYNER
jgi:16S rRNA (uracil1498-N3)-methyltransferase